jgi:sugar transferase (PEP-CTERM system associated)
VGGYVTYLALKEMGAPGHPGRLIGTAVVYFVMALVVFRGLVSTVRGVVGRPRVLIVGTGDEARSVFDNLNSQSHGEGGVVGFYATGMGDLDGSSVPGSKVFEKGATLSELVRRHDVQEIIVATREQRGGVMPMEQLLACRSRGVKVLDLAAFYERSHAEIPVDSLKASWLVYGDGFVQGPMRRTAKRVFDIVSSAILLVLASPVMLVAALAIKLDSAGPILYRQERVGLGGRSFMCVKFRSMRTDAERDGVARWASKNDSRVTRVGAIMRKTRIDELPQLISVLRGEMSMVGPRPERPSFVAELSEKIPFYDLRHSVKPGVTGWAQVRFSYGASVEDARRKHQFDLYYVKNNSVWLDIVVLLETVAVVLFREGAQ